MCELFTGQEEFQERTGRTESDIRWTGPAHTNLTGSAHTNPTGPVHALRGWSKKRHVNTQGSLGNV